MSFLLLFKREFEEQFLKGTLMCKHKYLHEGRQGKAGTPHPSLGAGACRMRLGAASWSPSLPGKFAPLRSTKTGTRQLDLLPGSMTASSLGHISLLPLSFISFSSLSSGYELLQNLLEQCKSRRQCKEQDTKRTCQNSSESMFTHNAKV